MFLKHLSTTRRAVCLTASGAVHALDATALLGRRRHGASRLVIQPMAVASASCLLCLFVSVSAQGAIESRSVLKTYFETGDIPTEEQFSDLIDSYIHRQDDGVAIIFESGASLDSHSVRSATGGVVGSVGNQGWDVGHLQDALAARDDNLSPHVDLGDGTAWPGAKGYLGFSVQGQEPGQAPTTHYGFLQLSVDGPGSPDPYAIRIVGVAIETTPDTPITFFQVPEPASATLVALGGLMLARRRRA